MLEENGGEAEHGRPPGTGIVYSPKGGKNGLLRGYKDSEGREAVS